MSKSLKDVIVKVTRKFMPLSFNDLDKVLFITTEVEKPVKRYSSLEAIETDFGTNSKIYNASKIWTAQTDAEGNLINPDFYQVGGTTGAIDTFLDSVTDTAFYGIVLDSYDTAKIEALDLWLTRNRRFAIVPVSAGVGENAVTEKINSSQRLYFLYEDDIETPFKVHALSAQTFMQGASARWKDRRLKGVLSSKIDQAKESSLLDKNVNAVVEKYGYIVTNGSWCADGETHADQTIKIDSIVFDIEENLFKLMANRNNLFMDHRGMAEIESVLARIMDRKGQDNIIAQRNDGSFAYRIKMPDPEDGNPLTGITVDDFIARTLRNVVIEATITNEIEHINVTFVWNDEITK